MDQIFVTNKNDFHHQDKYDGILFEFQPGEKTVVPVIAAAHMFGFGKVDKTETLVRLGWANRPDGVQMLAKFVFTKGVMVEAPAELPAPVVAAAPSSSEPGPIVIE